MGEQNVTPKQVHWTTAYDGQATCSKVHGVYRIRVRCNDGSFYDNAYMTVNGIFRVNSLTIPHAGSNKRALREQLEAL